MNEEIIGICFEEYLNDLRENETNETEKAPKNIKDDVVGKEEIIIDEERFTLDVLRSENFRISFEVDNSHLPRIIGRKRSNLRALQLKTKTLIQVPKKKSNPTEYISITGKEKEDIILAYRKIQMLLLVPLRSFKLTHFISIPMTATKFQEKYELFRTNVLEKCGNDRGVREELFQKKEKLHLTLGVLILPDSAKEKLAIDALEKCKEFVINPALNTELISAEVRGLQCMNNNTSKVNVLYGKITTNDRLQTLVENVVDFFVDADLMKKERNNVLLHLTLMNTKFTRMAAMRLKKKDISERPKFEKTFDATNILQHFGDYDFGEIEITSMHLSQFKAKSEDGYYMPSSKINF